MHDIHHSFSVCSLRRLFFDYLQVDYAASIWVGGRTNYSLNTPTEMTTGRRFLPQQGGPEGAPSQFLEQ